MFWSLCYLAFRCVLPPVLFADAICSADSSTNTTSREFANPTPRAIASSEASAARPIDARSAILRAVPDPDHAIGQLVELGRDECIQLLAETGFGRLAVSPPDWNTPPVIRPVTYAFDRSSQSVVFRTARGSKFTALLLSGQAAFEIDGIEPATRTGWSVIVQGPVEEVKNTAELHRLDRLELHPWAPGEKPHWVRLRVMAVSGRRVAP